VYWCWGGLGGIGYGIKSAIVNEVGGQSFHFYHVQRGSRWLELWRFSYGDVGMTGDVKNLDMEYYMGRDSDTWAFKLLFVMTK